MNDTVAKRPRLQGLDLARYFALVGMVLVNFGVVMVTPKTDLVNVARGDASWIVEILQGRAAATFVVLAGIGLGLSAKSKPWRLTVAVAMKRVAFLLALGLLNMLVFDADIIHYYAFYFLFGVWFLRAPVWGIMATIALIIVVQVAMVVGLDYDAGWDWSTYTYRDFWTPAGFVRNLFFNGWHPIVPWLAFLLFGMLISRMQLGDRRTQFRLLGIGITVFVLTMVTSSVLISEVEHEDAEAAVLFTTAPVPPMPLYMLAGGSIGCAVIGLCLFLETQLSRSRLLGYLTAAGRQTLTLYIAHILIGMGILESLGMIGGQTTSTAIVASVIFCVFATLIASIWSRSFKRGPIESVMRKLAG